MFVLVLLKNYVKSKYSHMKSFIAIINYFDHNRKSQQGYFTN